MFSRTVNAKIEKKRKYAYITLTDYGIADDEDDPWSLPMVSTSGDYLVRSYRILLRDCFLFEDALKNLCLHHLTGFVWQDAESALCEFLSDTYETWENLDEVFFRAGIFYKRLPDKSGNLNDKG